MREVFGISVVKEVGEEKKGGRYVATHSLTRRNFLKTSAVAAGAVLAAGAIDNTFVNVDAAFAEEDGEEQIINTSCRACIQNCACKAVVKNGRVVRVFGDPCDPMSEGRMCAKGLSAVQALYNPNRLKYPVKRVGERGTNQWERISWEEAINTIADALMEMDEKGDSMQLVTSTGGGGNPQFFSAIRFAGVNQSNFFEPGCAQCYLPRNMTQPQMNGTSDNSIADSDAQEIYYPDSATQCLVLWGSNPACSSPSTGGRGVANLRRLGCKTIVLDPRFTPDASKADVWLPIRPGTDVAMMMAWIREILATESYDADFVMKWTNLPYLINEETMLQYKASELGIGGDDEYVVWDQKTNAPAAMPFPWNDELDPALDGEFEIDGKTSRTGFRALKESVEEFTIDKAAEICWCEAGKIKEAIDIYVAASPAAGINLGVATDQYEQSAQAAQGATILDIITGNIQRPGNLTQKRASAFPLTYLLHPYGMFGEHPLAMEPEKIAARLGYKEHKGLGFWFASHIPTIREALETGKPYQPKIWMDRSGNKPIMLGGANQFLEAAKNFELIVHMYMYLTTMSVEMADIVLPTCEWLETAYIAQRMHKMLIRRDIVHLYEAVDETMAWSWIAFAMAERGHERFQMAVDNNIARVEGQPLTAYWKTYDEYKDYIAGFAGSSFGQPELTWAEFEAMEPPFDWIGEDEWRNTYGDYEQINEETGLPNGFATASGKCEPYFDLFTKMGRTGYIYGRPDVADYLEPVEEDYPPVLYYKEPDESPLTDEEYPYVLTQGRVPYYHHGTLRNVPWLREIYPVPECWINPVTAEEIGVETGDWVKLESRRGETHGKVLVTEGVAPGVIYQERFWNPELLDSENPKDAWQAMNINVLTRNDGPFNPEFGTYTLRGFQIKITKSEKPEGVWEDPTDFTPWLPEVTDETGGGYAVYGA